MTNYKPTSSIHGVSWYDREFPGTEADYKTSAPGPKNPRDSRDDKKTLLDKILGIFK